MQKLKINHTPRDVKVLTDQLVDAARSRPVLVVGTVTLSVSATSTSVSHSAVTASSVVVLTPQHANAQGVPYWISYSSGSFTIHHGSTATTDRTFGYVVF